MAQSYSQLKLKITEITTRIRDNRNRLDTAKGSAALAVTDLTAMQTAYAATVADIDAQLASAPTNAAFAAMSADKNALVAEFNALRTAATNMKTAIDAIQY